MPKQPFTFPSLNSLLRKLLFSYVSLSTLFLLSSCFNEKKFTYFQKPANGKDTITIAQAYIPKIQTGDILSIYVNSLSPEASSFFNPYSANAAGVSSASSASVSAGGGLSQTAAPGFLVDASGNIDLPLIGSVTVNGLTTIQARDLIKKKLEIYLKEPTVSIRFLNYKVSILGEVKIPGTYVIPNERITIPEALTLAGDLTDFAKRNEVEVIRDVNNKKEFGTLDLTSRDLFSSPYYYLHANDVVYVKPSKSRAAQTDLLLRVLPIAVSFISLIIAITR